MVGVGSEDDADGLLEAVDVAQHRGLGRVAVAVADRLEQLAVLAHGVAELLDAVEREEPDPQAEQVVLAERGRRGTGCACSGRRAGGCAGRGRSGCARRRRPARAPASSASRLGAVGGRAALGGGARGGRLEQPAHLGQAGQVARVDAGHEHAAAREDLDQPLVGERRAAPRGSASGRGSSAPSGRAR